MRPKRISKNTYFILTYVVMISVAILTILLHRVRIGLLILATCASMVIISNEYDNGVFHFRNIFVSVLFTLAGVFSTQLMYFVENGAWGGFSLFGAILFLPIIGYMPLIWIFKLNGQKAVNTFTLCTIASLFILRINCFIAGCCIGLPIYKNIRYPVREAELLFQVLIFQAYLKQINAGENINLMPHYMIDYGVFRFLCEFFRVGTNVATIGPLEFHVAHLWAIVAIAVGGLIQNYRMSATEVKRHSKPIITVILAVAVCATVFSIPVDAAVAVTWDANGGTFSDGTTSKVITNGSVPSAPTYTSYTFDGWYSSKTGGGTVLKDMPGYTAGTGCVSETFNPTSATTMYARWKKVLSSGKDATSVIYYANGGEIYIQGEKSGADYYKDDQTSSIRIDDVNASNFPRSSTIFRKVGYRVENFNTKPDGSGYTFNIGDTARVESSASDTALILYAQWVPCYEIVYDANGGTENYSATANFGYPKGNKHDHTVRGPDSHVDQKSINTFYADNVDLTVTNGPYTDIHLLGPNHKVFDHWNTKADGSGTSYYPDDKITFDGKAPQSETMYAQYADGYTINFLPGSGAFYYDTFGEGGLSRTKKPAKKIDGQCYSFTFNPKYSAPILKGASGSVPFSEDPEYFILWKDGGWLFTGFSENASGKGTRYFNSSVPYGIARYPKKSAGSIVNLYAQWEKVTTVTFDANGGEITYHVGFNDTKNATTYTISTSPFFKDVIPSTTFSIDHRWWEDLGTTSIDGIEQTDDTGTLTAPSKIIKQDETGTWTEPSGKVFTCWNTKADGTGTSYAAGDPIPCTANGGSITLYAQYSSAKAFKEWNTKADGTGTSYQPGDALPDSNLDLYAQWK